MLKVGDKVEVKDQGLAMLRSLCPGLPPNNIGRVREILDDAILVEFKIGKTWKHSQVSLYDRRLVTKTR